MVGEFKVHEQLIKFSKKKSWRQQPNTRQQVKYVYGSGWIINANDESETVHFL